MEYFDLEKEISQIPDEDYWELKKYKNETFSIQWTPRMSGWVKAKLDDFAEWGYINCRDPRIAEQFGLHIIKKQKEEREKPSIDTEDWGYCPFYQGA